MWEEQGRMKSREEGKEGRSCMQPQKYSNQRPFLGSQINQMFYYMDEPNFGRSLHFRKKKTPQKLYYRYRSKKNAKIYTNRNLLIISQVTVPCLIGWHCS